MILFTEHIWSFVLVNILYDVLGHSHTHTHTIIHTKYIPFTYSNHKYVSS